MNRMKPKEMPEIIASESVEDEFLLTYENDNGIHYLNMDDESLSYMRQGKTPGEYEIILFNGKNGREVFKRFIDGVKDNVKKNKREMDVVILNTQSGDWEGLYVNGKLISEGHTICRMGLLEMAEEHRFTVADIRCMELEDEDEEDMESIGSFYKDIKEFKGKY